MNTKPSGPIVLGTDGSESAAGAFDAAVEIAQARGADLVVVTAWKSLRGDFGLPYERLLAPDAAEIEREWAEQTAEGVAAKARELGIHAEPVVRQGRPARVICAIAEERAAALIVVGATGWGPIEGLLIGSVSRGVLNRAHCPVLVVRTPGSPKGQ